VDVDTPTAASRSVMRFSLPSSSAEVVHADGGGNELVRDVDARQLAEHRLDVPDDAALQAAMVGSSVVRLVLDSLHACAQQHGSSSISRPTHATHQSSR